MIKYLQNRFRCDFVDVISEHGPNRILAEQNNPQLVQSIFSRLKISVERHQSRQIAIAGHHDCAGNPVSKDKQMEHIKNAVEFVADHFPSLTVI